MYFHIFQKLLAQKLFYVVKFNGRGGLETGLNCNGLTCCILYVMYVFVCRVCYSSCEGASERGGV